MTKREAASAWFAQGFSCSQSVLAAYAEDFGLDPEMALRVAGAFGGGMGRTGQVCGAVTGALMVIGLKYGKVKAEDNATRDKGYAVTAEFMRRFQERHGALTCPGLLGYDIGTPEGRAAVQEKKLSSTLCPLLVADAAEMVEELLKNEA